MEIADRVDLELLLRGRLVASDLRQSTDAVTLKTTVQRRARQHRNRCLKRIEAIVERQQRVLAKGNSKSFLLRTKDGRGWGVSVPSADPQRCSASSTWQPS